jgi:hypothetical protein
MSIGLFCFPAAREKPGKIFSDLAPHEKISCTQMLGHDIRQKLQGWQGTGRETPKASGIGAASAIAN